MIDFVKFSIDSKEFVKSLKSYSELNFETKTTSKGNQVFEATYNNMLVQIFEPSQIVCVCGSFHYLFNGGLHNWNDYKRLDLYDTVMAFCNLFNIDPQKAILHGFEFGVNVEVPFDPARFIEGVLGYKTGVIERLTKKAEKRDAIKIQFDQYRIKLYSKSKQFQTPIHILRFEVKISRMIKLSHIQGLRTLNDLLKPQILSKLGEFLIKEFKELIVLETMQIERMTKRDKTSFERMNNREFWESITNKSLRRNYKKRFRELTYKYGNGMFKEVEGLILTKWSDLLELKQVEQKTKKALFNRGDSQKKAPYLGNFKRIKPPINSKVEVGTF